MASMVRSDALREEDTRDGECTRFSLLVEFAVGLNATSPLVNDSPPPDSSPPDSPPPDPFPPDPFPPALSARRRNVATRTEKRRLSATQLGGKGEGARFHLTSSLIMVRNMHQ